MQRRRGTEARTNCQHEKGGGARGGGARASSNRGERCVNLLQIQSSVSLCQRAAADVAARPLDRTRVMRMVQIGERGSPLLMHSSCLWSSPLVEECRTPDKLCRLQITDNTMHNNQKPDRQRMPGQESKPRKSGVLKEKNDTPNEFGKNTEFYWIVRRQEYILRDKTPLWLRNVAPLWLRNGS